MPWQRVAASVAGMVTSSAGGPIRGAKVCLWPFHADLPTRLGAPRCTETTADGRYRLTELPPLRFEVHASAAEHLPAQFEPANRVISVPPLQPGEERLNVDLQLDTGGVEVRGTVVDLAGGVVEGADVTALTARRGWSSRLRPRSVAVTDADGRFSLWVESGTIEVQANAEGYAAGAREGRAPGRTFEVVLTPESVLVGQVVMNGEPVPDAVVRVSEHQTFSDVQGRFRLEGLEPGVYQPEAYIDEAYGRASRSIAVGLAEISAPFILELHPAALIEGTVLIGSHSGPLCDRPGLALVELENPRRSYYRNGDAGNVRIPGVPNGTYLVRVDCPDHTRAGEEENLVIDGASPKALRWVVQPGRTISGFVRDEYGEPVPGVAISARARTPGQTFRDGRYSAKSSASGAFELRGLAPDTYHLSVLGEGVVALDVEGDIEVHERDATRDIEISRGGTAQGRVIDVRGEPVPDARVRLGSSRELYASLTADDGTFRIEGIAPGEHRAVVLEDWRTQLRAPGEDDDTARGKSVLVALGETTNVELVVARKDGAIRGRVLDATGGPVADAFVSADRERDGVTSGAKKSGKAKRWRSWGQQPVLTDADGRFELQRLAEGRYTVHAHRRGGGEGSLEQVDLGADVVVRFNETGALRGRLKVRGGGGAPESFTVRLVDESTGAHRSDDFYRTDGTFEFEDVVAGEYEVSVTSEQGDGATRVLVKEGDVVEDVQIELAPKVRMHGRVLDLDSGQPVPGMRVSVGAASTGVTLGISGSSTGLDVTDTDGRFTLERGPTGPVILVVLENSMSFETYGWTQIEMEVPDQADSFEIPDLKVVLNRKPKGQPDADLGFRLRPSSSTEGNASPALEIVFVRPASPASEGGLQVGDLIETVDGHDVTGENTYLLSGLLSVAVGTRVTFGLVDGTSKTIVAGPP